MNHKGLDGTQRKDTNFILSWNFVFFVVYEFGHQGRQTYSPSGLRLVVFDQFTNSQRVGLAVAVAGDRSGAAGGIDANV